MKPYGGRVGGNTIIKCGLEDMFTQAFMSDIPFQKLERERKNFAWETGNALTLINFLEREEQEIADRLYGAYARLDELEAPPPGMLSHLCQICTLQKNRTCRQVRAGKVCDQFCFWSQAKQDWIAPEEGVHYETLKDAISAAVYRRVFGKELHTL